MSFQWTLLLLPVFLAIGSQNSVAAFLPTRTTSFAANALYAKPPSWDAIEGMLGPAYTTPTPSSIDSVLNPEPPTFSTDKPTLFRERHGWCPYSERVWLTLEILNQEYDTIRIDNTGGGRPSYFGGQTPQMKWPDGQTQGESYDLVQALDAKYNNHQLASDNADISNVVKQFRNIFPRARPSSRAAYLFQYNGEPLWKSTFEETLEQTNELLGQGAGPFLGGSDIVTAADIAWAPFLERYRYQLPCLHRGLQPDNPEVYPNLAAWYKAMEDGVPAYACRVKGDASSWRKVLSMAGFGNSFTPPQIVSNMDERTQLEFETAASCIQQDVWERYSTDRPNVASTPGAEAALIMTRNRNRILKDIQKQQQRKKIQAQALPESEEELDATLRGLVSVLLQSEPSDWDTASLDNEEMVGSLAAFLDERMCVPRDMGAMSAACIKDLAWRLSS